MTRKQALSKLLQKHGDNLTIMQIMTVKKALNWYDEDVAMDIMLKNLVCSDFFEWNFEEWRPYTEEEIKNMNIKKR